MISGVSSCFKRTSLQSVRLRPDAAKKSLMHAQSLYPCLGSGEKGRDTAFERQGVASALWRAGEGVSVQGSWGCLVMPV